jgi:hypothetical protein
MMGTWDNRELCSDGACIGVIGADGTCNVCGTRAPNWSPDRRRDDGDDSVESDSVPEPDDLDVAPASSAAADLTGDPDWDNRTLCPDGSCTGLIAGTGKCSVCRRTAAEIIAESAT